MLPSGYVKIAIENDHWNSGFSHKQWWFSIVMLIYQRVAEKTKVWYPVTFVARCGRDANMTCLGRFRFTKTTKAPSWHARWFCWDDSSPSTNIMSMWVCLKNGGSTKMVFVTGKSMIFPGEVLKNNLLAKGPEVISSHMWIDNSI